MKKDSIFIFSLAFLLHSINAGKSVNLNSRLVIFNLINFIFCQDCGTAVIQPTILSNKRIINGLEAEPYSWPVSFKDSHRHALLLLLVK